MKKKADDLIRNAILSGLKRVDTDPESTDNPEIVRAYNSFISITESLNGIMEKSYFHSVMSQLRDLWKSIESCLPVLREEEIVKTVRREVGFVDFSKCVTVAESLSKYDRPVRFHEIKESVMDSPEFARLRNSSVNKVLDRVMRYLREARLVIRCERIGKTGRVSDVYYFRMFSFLNDSDNGCENCARLKKLIADKLRDLLNMVGSS